MRSTCVIVVVVAAMSVWAGRTGLLVENSYERWVRGEAWQVVIEPEGALRLGPGIVCTGVFPIPMVDAVLVGEDGRIYVSGGGKVYAQRTNGSNELVAAFEEEKVTALAMDKEGTLYLGVTPGGVIYRREKGGVIVRVADTGERYIWGLEVDEEGGLLVATGRRGILQRITFTGSVACVRTLLDSAEENITAIARLGGVVYAGTSPRGYVYRIRGTNEVYLLLDTRASEVTSLLVESNGVVWVATMGSAGGAGVGVGGSGVGSGPAAAVMTGLSGATGTPGTVVSIAPPGGGPNISRVFRITPDGFSEVYWQTSEPVLYGLAQHKDGSVYVGSGNKGRLFALRERGKAALVAQLPARQIVGLRNVGMNDLLVVCTEPALHAVLGAGFSASGRFESAVLQVPDVVRWGRIEIEGNMKRQVRVLTRSGNCEVADKSWSGWEEASENGRIVSPPARGLQYALELGGVGAASPVVRAVKIYYAEPNRAPVLDVVVVSPPHTELAAQVPSPPTPGGGGLLGQFIQEWLAAAGLGSTSGIGVPGVSGAQMMSGVIRLHSFGARTIAWQAQDPNGDALSARVWIGRVGEQPEWILLTKERRQSFLTFNGREWEDGRYRVRVRVSDRGAVAPGEELYAERVSDSFLIDNTPPVIEDVALTMSKDGVRARCRVRDALSNIASLQYVVEGGEARSLVPIDGVFDEQVEDFEVMIVVGRGVRWLRLVASDEQKNVCGVVRRLPAEGNK
ncbi:MAG: hypothetical protein N2595_10530 [bacterium]|nr:hypothetical protein [bacterium]